MNIESAKAILERDGVTILEDVLDECDLSMLRRELELAIEEDGHQYPDAFDKGMVHNCMFRGQMMANILDTPILNSLLAEVLGESFIVYAYQSSSLMPGALDGNYGSRIHVDSPRFIDNYSTNFGVIFPLDDFTEENGATYYLPGSHKVRQITEHKAFYDSAERIICKKGDMIVFNARLHHAAGINQTQTPRHALTINFCRCFMRQRFDFVRMQAFSEHIELSENTKKLLGWNVRMPISLDEFYLPEDQRLYRSGQE